MALASRNTTLPPGNRKYFCEADCHIAYSIENVTEASTLGPETKPITAQGRLVIVHLKTWFDEHSIAPFRGNVRILFLGTKSAFCGQARYVAFGLKALSASQGQSNSRREIHPAQ